MARLAPRWCLGVTALAVAAAACGTTVDGTRDPQSLPGLPAPGASPDGAALTAGGPGPAAAPGAGGAGAEGGVAAGASAGDAATGAAGAATSTGAGTGGSRSRLAAAGYGPGVDDKRILVGIPYTVNGAAANAAIGGAGITQGDEKGEALAVIDDINKHGGVLGRTLVPVFHPVDALSDDTADSQYEALCADFTQDHHVFVFVVGGDPIVERCAQRAGAVEVYDNLTASSAATFRQFPSYVEISMMNYDRIALNEVAGLDAQHYFDPWDATVGAPAHGGAAKVGIIAYDTPDFHHAVDQVLRPALARIGHAAATADTVYVAVPQRTSDLSQQSAAESSALVKFRQDGVEHVLILDVTGLLTLEFLNVAQSQHYFPRYGWNSQNAPEALAAPGDVPAQQMVGSVGIGFAPGIDLSMADNPDDGPYSSDARRSCLALMRRNGFTFSDANSRVVALLTCNDYYFIKAAIEAGGPAVNQASFIAGVARLGGSFPSASTFRVTFGPDKHDGAAAYRTMAWVPSCTCIRYTSGLRVAL